MSGGPMGRRFPVVGAGARLNGNAAKEPQFGRRQINLA